MPQVWTLYQPLLPEKNKLLSNQGSHRHTNYKQAQYMPRVVLFAGNSVHWCLRRLICADCGSPATCLIWHAVALELSILFASCCTLLAGNLSRSTFPSLIVLDTNSSSHSKNQKMLLCMFLAVSGGYFARLTCACTTLYQSSTLLLPCLKLVRRSKWASPHWIEACRIPQISPDCV